MTAIALNDGWAYRRPVGPFAGIDGAAPATPAQLPHDALRDEQRSPDAPGGGSAAYYPHGAFTYLRELEVPEHWRGKTVGLEVQGAYRRAQVFLNEELAGVRADGYARFFVDLTPYLLFGATNHLRIEVRSGEDSRWYSGAGLHRPVVLHVDEPVHIVPDGTTVRTVRVEDDEAILEVVTTVRNTGAVTETARVETVLEDPSGAAAAREQIPLTLAPGERADARQILAVAEPALWSPDSPALHTARVRLVDAGPTLETRFGIRTVTVDPRRGLRINGEEVLLRGACIHSDNGPLGAAAVGRADARRIERLKAAGFNAIRAAHNPVSIATLEACDRVGMLVIDEAFDMWTRFKTPQDYAMEFPQWWEEDLASLVRKDRNHPSVIMYSIGNEIAEVGTPHGARWARRLATRVRELDPTRPVTNGVNAFLAVLDEVPQIVEELGGLNAAMAAGGPFSAISDNDTVTERIEESSSVLDVLGLNYAESRYERERHRVVVGSETFPAAIGRLWPLVQRHPHVIGDFTWTGWDYLGEVGIGSTAYADDPSVSGRLEREYPFLTAWCGDLDITGWRRPLSYYREIVFGLRTAPSIAVQRPAYHGVPVVSPSPWAWSDSVSSWTWPGREGLPVVVEVAADADEVVLLLDGTEIARAAVGTELPMLARLEVEYAPGTLTAVAHRDGAEVGRSTLRTAGPAGLSVTAEEARIVHDDDALVFVEIELRDEGGTLVMCEDREVTVSVSGPLALAGMCSANPKTAERFDSSTWRTFDGRALAVLRPTGTGDAEVSVTADGLGEQRLSVSVAAAPGAPALA